MYILGQFLGILATIACIIVPFFKKKWQMLVNTILVNTLMAMNFVLIGEIGSAVCLCSVAVVQSTVTLLHTARNTEAATGEKILFLCLYVGFGFYGLVNAPGFVPGINARNVIELLPIVGSIMSMLFVFVPDEAQARKFLLATSGVWVVYMAIIGSTGFFAQIVALITTCMAMFKYRQKAAA